MAAHDFHGQREAYDVAQLIDTVEIEVQGPLQTRLPDSRQTTAGHPFAQQHTKHGGLRRILQRDGGEVDPWRIGPGRNIQLFRPVPAAQGEHQLLPGGLVDFIDAGIPQGILQFRAQAGQKRAVKGHVARLLF